MISPLTFKLQATFPIKFALFFLLDVGSDVLAFLFHQGYYLLLRLVVMQNLLAFWQKGF